MGSMFFVLEFLEPFFFPSFDFFVFLGRTLVTWRRCIFWLEDLVEYCGVTYSWVSSVFSKISCTSWRRLGLVSLVSFRSLLSSSLFALADGMALVFGVCFTALA